jgi:hypothetical protein
MTAKAKAFCDSARRRGAPPLPPAELGGDASAIAAVRITCPLAGTSG